MWHVGFHGYSHAQSLSVRQSVTRADGPPLVHTIAGATNLASKLATANRYSFGGSGDHSAEEARSLPLSGTCEDSSWKRLTWSMLSNLTLPCQGIKAVQGSTRSAGAKHLARLRLPQSRTQFYHRWGGLSVLAHVEDAVEESEALLGLDATWVRVERSTSG